MAARELRTDVLVVGAGPTGLLLATLLTRLGVSTTVVDGKSGPTRESRALGVQARTMEIYDQLGIVERVLAKCTLADQLAPGFGGRILGRVRLGRLGAGITPYPGIHVFEQSENERLLVDALAECGGDEVLWGHRLIELADAECGGVVATLASPVRSATIRARYCVGADGGSSAVRKSRGIRFEGITNEHTFYVLDATAVQGLAHDAINVRPGPEDFLLTFPMGAGGHARLLGTVRDAVGGGVGDDGARGVAGDPGPTEDVVRARLRRLFSVTYGTAAWFSTYRVHHRIADRFRDGPVFLAGDAAHVHSPVGAQGMNTGLQDAHNLAFKLADVIQGRASNRWLDRYEAERRPVAQRLISTTDRVFGLVTSDRAVLRVLRRWVVSIVAPVSTAALPRVPAASRLFGYVSQTRIHYWMSDRAKAEAGGRRGRVVGRRLPYAGDNFAPLRSLTWQVHAYGSTDPGVVERVRSALGVDVQVLPAPGGAAAPAERRVRAGRLYLVRPDGFVAAEATPDTAVEAFAAALPTRPVSRFPRP